MQDTRGRLGPDDIAVGLDLASKEHQVVIMNTQGKRLTRFRIRHSREGFEELLRRSQPALLQRATGRRVFAFEATGHFWEALAAYLSERGETYVVVNPLATFRVREARQMDRHKTDLTDAEQVAELLRNGVVTRTQLEKPNYLALRRAWGEYVRLRSERSRLKTLLAHQLYGLFPEFLGVWSNILQPGPLAVLRLGLTPHQVGTLPLSEFIRRVREHRRGRRLWRYKLEDLHQWARRTVVSPHGLEPMAREIQRIIERIDMLSEQMNCVVGEIDLLLEQVEEAPYLRTIPGLGWCSVVGLIAHVGAIDKYHHGRQLIKLAGTNPSRHDTGKCIGRMVRMTHRGRAGLREVIYMASISCLQHNPRIRAHYDRLIQRPERPLTKMQALGACMNKLLLYAFAVMKRRHAFDLNHIWQERTNERAA